MNTPEKTDSQAKCPNWASIIKRFLIIAVCLIVLWNVLGFFNILFILGLDVWGATTYATEAQAEGRLDAALRWANWAMILGRSSMTYGVRGNIYEARKEYPKAISDFTKAIECDRGGTCNYIDRGRVYEKMGQLKEAVADYCHAILTYPDSVYGPQNWAEERAECEGPQTIDQMIDVFDRAIEKDPSNESFQKARKILVNAERFEKTKKSSSTNP